MKVYIAGPMTGIPDYNYPAFHRAAHHLRLLGFEVANPAEHFGGDQTLEHHVYIRQAIKSLLDCDAIYTLPGWRASVGAKIEMAVARVCRLQHINATGLDMVSHIEAVLVATNPPKGSKPRLGASRG